MNIAPGSAIKLFSGTHTCSAQLQLLQDTGLNYFTQLGLNRAVLLREYGAFWAIARVELCDVPPIPDLQIETHHYCRHGQQWILEYRFFTDKLTVGNAYEIWSPVSFAQRTLVPIAPIPGDASIHMNAFRRIKIPHDMEFFTSFVVDRSDLDENEHMNNVRYALRAEQLLPFLTQRKIQTICYHSEARLDDRIELHYAQRDDQFYICGKTQDRLCFEMIC